MTNTTKRLENWVAYQMNYFLEDGFFSDPVAETVLRITNQGHWKGGALGTLELTDQDGKFIITWDNVEELGGVAKIRQLAKEALV